MTWTKLAIKGALVAAAAGGTILMAHLRGRAAERAAPMRGEIVTGAEGVPIHLEIYGNPSAPPVVLIHGSSGSTYDMDFTLAGRLSERYRVIAVDRPGFGHSPMPTDESLAGQARAIRQAIAVMEKRKPIVLGQSYGGSVALKWAVDAPESLAALVLVAAPTHEWEGSPSLFHTVLSTPVLAPIAAWLIAAWTPRAYIGHEVGKVFHPQDAPAQYQDHFQPEMSLRPATHQLNARQRVRLKREIIEMARDYSRISVPIEAVHGTADEIVGVDIHSRRLVREVESAHLEPLDNIGHMPHHVTPDEVVAAVDRAWSRADKAF